MQHDSYHESTTTAGGARPLWPLRALCRMQRSINRIAETLALWHFRARSRRELEQLDDRLLRDAGVDRAEANKPFWRE